jgi:hypothetical protein
VTDDSVWQAAPQCSFYVRVPVTTDPATYRYNHVYVRGGPHGAGGILVTPHPPAVGDIIWLHDESGDHTGCHRVIERCWQHPAYGSAHWPHQSRRTTVGPILTIIVSPAVGPFRDEAEEVDNEEEQQGETP